MGIGQGQGPIGHFFPLLLNNYIKSSWPHLGEVGGEIG